MFFGERVRAFRVRQGISVRELARRAHISDAAISLLEQGKRAPQLTTAVALANALGVPIDELIESESEVAPSQPVPEP